MVAVACFAGDGMPLEKKDRGAFFFLALYPFLDTILLMTNAATKQALKIRSEKLLTAMDNAGFVIDREKLAALYRETVKVFETRDWDHFDDRRGEIPAEAYPVIGYRDLMEMEVFGCIYGAALEVCEANGFGKAPWLAPFLADAVEAAA